MSTLSLVVRAWIAVVTVIALAPIAAAQTATKLQVLLPGELAAPGSQTGKTGSPRAQNVGVPFEVIVNAVDSNNNLITSVNDFIDITSDDPKATLPTTVFLSGGTARFSVTFGVDGTFTITATDTSDPAKSPGTSSPVTALPVGAAEVAVTKLPEGMVAPAGVGGATDTYTLVNKGDVPTRVFIAQAAIFFTQTPSEFVLQPGQSQVVTIVSLPQPPGVFEGPALPRGDFVTPNLQIPVKLLSVAATAQAGDPNVQGVLDRIDTNDIETVALVNFRNTGSATATGMIVSSVAWLTPPQGAVVIDPGSTVQARVIIDRTKRSDLEMLYGSLEGRLDFVYAKQGFTRATASVTIVDTMLPRNAAPAIVPAFESTDVTRFLLGLTARGGQIADLSFSNTGTVNANDSTVYFIPAGGSAFFARALPFGRVPAGAIFEFGNVLRTIYPPETESSNVLLRTRLGDEIVAGATIQNPTTRGTFGTFAPLFRSERAITGGQSIYLTGLRKDATTRTDLYIQETAKAGATAQIDFFDVNGVQLGSRTVPLVDFSSVELLDAAPANAVLARVTSSSSSSGRIIAEARVVQSGGDIESIVDGSQQLGFSRGERQIIPIPHDLAGSALQTDVYITNTGSTAASGVLNAPGGSPKRRAVRSTGRPSPLDAITAVTLAPLQTLIVRNAGRAGTYLEFTPSGGQFVITARTFSASRGGGTTIPGIGESATLKNGDVRHYAGLDDASPSSINSRRGGTYRTSVGLVETTGADATVRVTVHPRYEIALAGAVDSISRDFTVGARQMLLIDEVVRSVVGSGRDSYNDLHDVEIDVAVVGGSGAVIPFVVSTENATGDLLFRVE